jgi:hypothetical protein
VTWLAWVDSRRRSLGRNVGEHGFEVARHPGAVDDGQPLVQLLERGAALTVSVHQPAGGRRPASRSASVNRISRRGRSAATGRR